MATMDSWLEGLLHGSAGMGVVLLVSLLLGLRHASDPDHLAAVTTLIASEEPEAVRKATFMGFSWGLGHGTTLILLGLPLVLLGQYLPKGIQQAAEATIGVIIVLLAVRLLVRWRRGVFHAHPHTHEGGETHRHLHSHADDSVHEHAHNTPLRGAHAAAALDHTGPVGGRRGAPDLRRGHCRLDGPALHRLRPRHSGWPRPQELRPPRPGAGGAGRRLRVLVRPRSPWDSRLPVLSNGPGVAPSPSVNCRPATLGGSAEVGEESLVPTLPRRIAPAKNRTASAL